MSDDKPLIDKRGNVHVFVREDYKFPAFVSFVSAELTDEQIAHINGPTHYIPAKDHDHTAVPSWRMVIDEHRLVLSDLKYGYAEMIDKTTLLLWFNTAKEASEAENKYGSK